MERLSPKKHRTIGEDDFDLLLGWLDPNRQRAAEKYENIRQALIELFTRRRRLEAEDLADETIDRVVLKLPGIRETYTGDPALYFYGVAKRIYNEVGESPRGAKGSVQPINHVEESSKIEEKYDCLEQCLDNLREQDRELIMLYYQQMIEARGRRAAPGRRSSSALRSRVYKIRRTLEKCVLNCMEQKGLS